MLNTGITNWKENTIDECFEEWKENTIAEHIEEWKKEILEEIIPIWEKNFKKNYISKIIKNLIAMGINEENIAYAVNLSLNEVRLLMH